MDDLRNTMDPVIFLEKVRRPVARGLARERLDRRLAELAHPDDGCSCVLLLAPPGSGKTTLLSQLVEATGLPAAWYRAGAEDADEVALTRHLGYAIGSALSDPAIIEAAASGRVADLLRCLDRPEVPRVQVVVDDLHELAGTPAETALEVFLRLRPRTIVVALGSRRQPGLNTSRLLVSGELIMIDGEDLRFRSWEVEQLFRTVYRAPLSPESAAALTRRTGGWAAGLQLFQLATAQLGRAERERAVTELSGRSRLIRSYLARNVLEGLSAHRRHFLLHTSALGVLTGDLCDALLETQGSAAVLAELEREQFFTTSSDGGLTYHYHQVFQTHLEMLLTDELGGRAARQLYSRSGRLLEEAGRGPEAVRAHARAEDWGAVARLMRPGTGVVDADDTLWRLLSLPGAPTDDPGLVLAGARRLARDGQVEPALAAYREAERLLDDPGFVRRCAVERQAVGLWLPQSPTSALPPSPAAVDVESTLLRLSIELRRLTRDVRHPGSYEHGWRRGLAYALSGDLERAERELGTAWSPTTYAPAWEPLAADLVACLIEMITSADERLAGRIETITLSAEMDGWPWLARLGRSLQTIAQLPGDGAWRAEAAFDLLAGSGHRGDRWSHLVASTVIAIVARQAGKDSLAVDARRQVEQTCGDLGAPVLLEAIDRLSDWLSDQQTARRAVAGAGLSVAEEKNEAVASRGSELAPPIARPVSDSSRGAGTPAARAPADGGLSGDQQEAGRPVIELSCLGGFALRVGGHEVDCRPLRPRARSLLMLLALHHGRPRHRELIIETLWPEATLASGIRSLQVAVSSVRQCLAAGGVVVDPIRRQGDAYELVLPGVVSDLIEFERLSDDARRQQPGDALAARTRALELYRGDLLPAVGPAEWVVEERDRLRLLAATVAAAAAADAVAVGDHGLAIELARRSITLDPFHDPAWTLLIDAYESLGDLSAAAVARGDHQRVWDDLGLVVPTRRSVPA